MLYAALVLPREPLQWAGFVSAIHLWLQNAGAVAAFGLGVWLLAQFLQRQRPFGDALNDLPPKIAGPLANVLTGLALLGILGYVFIGTVGIFGSLSPRVLGRLLPR